MKRSAPLKRSTPLKADPEKLKAWRERSQAVTRKNHKPRPVSSASKAQREKVTRMGGSIVSGQTPVDGAHIWPRGLGGCDDPLCVVPLTRAEHRAYDEGALDLLPHLLAHGLVEELAHALIHARGDLLGLLNRVTSDHYEPRRGAA